MFVGRYDQRRRNLKWNPCTLPPVSCRSICRKEFASEPSARRVRGKARLNIRDASESGRLQRVAINSDGSTYAYRIIDPRRFTLSTSFDL
jgi:hypothetical protein